MQERGRLLPGQLFNDEAVASPSTASLKASLVAASPNTTIISFSTNDVEKVAVSQRSTPRLCAPLFAVVSFVSVARGGCRAWVVPRGAPCCWLQGSKAQASSAKSITGANSGFKSINFADLEFHRIVGTGQFGLVRVVRNTKTNDVYALKVRAHARFFSSSRERTCACGKEGGPAARLRAAGTLSPTARPRRRAAPGRRRLQVMHKAPITESKQVEHVINERRILQEASHPFCVQLCGAYQDRNSLYLLQEWVPGGELFHHLDLEGAFDEPTAMFFAASVLMALEFLHSKNIVYRDLKPENLLLDAQGYIKVCARVGAPRWSRDAVGRCADGCVSGLDAVRRRCRGWARAHTRGCVAGGGLWLCQVHRAGQDVHHLRHARLPGARGEGVRTRRRRERRRGRKGVGG